MGVAIVCLWGISRVDGGVAWLKDGERAYTSGDGVGLAASGRS